MNERRDIYNEYKKLQHKIDAVTFDFFDTLFVRPLRDPEDLFDGIGQKCQIENFRELRQNAQRLGFKKMHTENRKEILFDDIYSCFDLPLIIKQKASNVEIELEEMLLYPNKEIVDFYNFCRKTKKVAIISDMYLPKEFFEKILIRHNLDFDEIFVSSELNSTKRDDGELFLMAAQTLGIEPSRILHIGDNLRSDVERAMEKSLNTFHYVELRDEPKTPAPFSESLAFSLYRTAECDFEDNFEAIGFKYGGPALSAFLSFLEIETRKDKIEKLLFISRDGYILNEVGKDIFEKSAIKTDYFRGSITAFNMSAITVENFDDFLPFLVSGCFGLSTHEILERIDVECPSPEVFNDIGLGDDVPVTEENLAQVLDFLISFKWSIINRAAENRKALFNYLLSLDVKRGMKLGLVDVGWSGTTLEAFSRALKGLFDVELTGYFLCLVDTPERIERSKTLRMKSLLNGEVITQSQLQTIYENRVIAELMFTAPHASVIGYEYDYSKTEVNFVVDNGRSLTEVRNFASPSLRRGMAKFNKQYRELHQKLGLTIPPKDAVRPFIEYLARSPQEQLSEFQDVKNFDVWGTSKNFDLFATSSASDSKHDLREHRQP
ncbi:HAD-IA family hydrolase [Agrobacterium vitis]|uniref:HAD-IA family hydrolase n=1 Tax=Rhizobium/Agrobacterium group TaxID=227290 RepID=UPI0009BF3257|nr:MULTISPECIES: HAD-IA family hydrolase [Rhizobium/Agrobacterium group]MCF1436975.1 HAD-IA family hydrolase [Allorhizobium ampelinum]MCF1474589.1 HAD-IA family hydrolase [Allorhizobium ampelinum]MUO92561.1 HAD-IA family hydrolase [Agrobacterium vitis]MUZ51990.1 HAD-IA family hydrolase [Agrobacterium vitis]MUZ89793.1 HAD-IA family hydrolase [Agrobacterium vitis]